MDVDEICPKCRSEKVVPIVYGLPGPEMFEAAERGEISLGGCELSFDNPVVECLDCRWTR